MYFREKESDPKKSICDQEGMKSEDNGKQVDKFNINLENNNNSNNVWFEGLN